MKVAVVGGGSTYTPELIDGLSTMRGAVRPEQIVLYDPATERLNVVGAMCTRLLAASGHAAALSTTSNLDEALDGAAIVVVQLRVGGQESRHRDETWPLEFRCLGQETTGAGGLAKAMRTVPVVLDIAERARKLAAPGAWIVDFTNPVGIVTRALLDAGHRAVGLCNVAVHFQRWVADLVRVSADRVRLDHVGLNHLTWVRGVEVDGRNRLPELLDTHGEVIAEHVGLQPELLRATGTVPSYYLRYYYRHDREVAAQYEGPTRAQEVTLLERELLALYADPTVDHKPALLSRRGGTYYSVAAVELLESLVANREEVHVLNVRNEGTLPFLPDGAVIEAPARVCSSGIRAEPAAVLDPLFAGLVGHVAAYEELALDAALRGGHDRVRAALLAHPLIGQFDVASGLADRLLAENAGFLS